MAPSDERRKAKRALRFGTSPSVVEKAKELDKAIDKIVGERSQKHDAGKPPVELVPAQFVEDISRVLGHGAKKYERNDWTKGLPWTRIYAAVIRHMYAWFKGEDLDPESGLPHLAHAATNIMFLLTWSKTRKENDDRFKYE